MRIISKYINEALLSKDNKTAISKEKDPRDPNTWEVGDVLFGIYGKIVALPRFYKIVKIKRDELTVVRLKGEIVEGHRNGNWKEVATEEIFSNQELKGKIRKNDDVVINGIQVLFYDGSPIKGFDKI